MHSRPAQVGSGCDHNAFAWHVMMSSPISSYPVSQEKVVVDGKRPPLVVSSMMPFVGAVSVSHSTPMHSGMAPTQDLSGRQSKVYWFVLTSWYPVLHEYVAWLGYRPLFEVETDASSTPGGVLHT